ncbi:hypothetical protein EYZ11_012531 [Aspergillus tanneri]|uniref:Uncharacterized protein n=1 Tax=Aspergillus tanneri TaxID=1220188 RepID=A0A4S3J0K7_9EURO|nr:hypothetical protein EYZ11_012531 [Aspergillus tanneri]
MQPDDMVQLLAETRSTLTVRSMLKTNTSS